MKRKMMAILLAVVMIISLTACGAGKETTLTGMVVSVDGTKISLVEMDASSMESMGSAGGERPEVSGGMEGFQNFGDFNFEEFNGTMPEGGNYPQWGGEMPEGGNYPQWGGEMPEGGNYPQWGNGEMPEDFSMPQDGSMPNFGGGMPNFGGSGDMSSWIDSFASDAERKELDLSEAHISVEIEGGKESGSMDNIKAGTFVTVTMDGKGKVTYVLVSAQSVFGGGRGSRS